MRFLAVVFWASLTGGGWLAVASVRPSAADSTAAGAPAPASAASPGGATLAADSSPHFPLRVGDDHRHLVDQDGRPFFYNADTCWKLFVRLTLEEAEAYLERRKAQGFTAVQAILTGFLGDKTVTGERPFDEAQDLAKPNEAFFAHVDAVVERAGRLGLLLPLAPAWAGCCREGWAGKEKDGTLKPLDRAGPDKVRAFGAYLGRRYGRFPHVMWIFGGDSDPGTGRPLWDALAAGIKSEAPGQLITFHPASSHSSTDALGDPRWLDVAMTYTYFRGFNKAWNKNQPDVYEIGAREWMKAPPRPFFLGESTYEGEHDAWGSPLQARKQAYWAVLAGGIGNAYGSPNWKVPADWRRVLELPGANSLGHFRRLFTARPWERLVPDFANEVAVDGRGPYGSNDYATTARAADGSFVVSYLPTPRTVTIDLGRLSGKTIDAFWFDPRTGRAKAAGRFPARGRRPFTPPKAGPTTAPAKEGGTDQGRDWVLLLDDAQRAFPALPVPPPNP